MPGTASWRTLLHETVERFREAVLDEPEISARRIIEEASGWDGAEFALHLDDPSTERTIAHLDQMVARRLRGEPVQYVVGRWDFRSLDLMVDHRVLIPRPETEEVAGLAIQEARRFAAAGIAPTVVDLGTGSGAIGLSLAVEVPEAEVHLTDASTDAAAVARANLTGLGRSARRVSIWEGSWFEALPRSLAGTLHVVVSNPPYVRDDDKLSPTVADWEPAMALRAGPKGLDDLHEIVHSAPTWLSEEGSLVLEMAPDQVSIVARWCTEAGFVRTDVCNDLSGRSRAIVAHRTDTGGTTPE